MDNITLYFSTQQLDYLVQVLAARPYGEVAFLLQSIKDQVQIHNQGKAEVDAKSLNGQSSLPLPPQ